MNKKDTQENFVCPIYIYMNKYIHNTHTHTLFWARMRRPRMKLASICHIAVSFFMVLGSFLLVVAVGHLRRVYLEGGELKPAT